MSNDGPLYLWLPTRPGPTPPRVVVNADHIVKAVDSGTYDDSEYGAVPVTVLHLTTGESIGVTITLASLFALLSEDEEEPIDAD